MSSVHGLVLERSVPYIHMMANNTLESTLSQLRRLARPDQLDGMARFGIVGKGRLGVPIPELRKLARAIGRNHTLARQLWKTHIPEAMILAGYIAEPYKLTSREMDSWAKDFQSWDVCDQVCSSVFDKHPAAWDKIERWTRRKEEFVKRAGFVLIAALAVHDKTAPDSRFLALLPIIRRESLDDRNFVRKAVNWALRQVGKRNPHLRAAACAEAARIGKIDSRSARWIASDALRELT